MTVLRKTISLNPGETKEVTFSFKATEAKDYSVSVGDLTGGFRAIPLPGPEFAVTNLVIEPSEVYIGEQVSISVTVTNVGAVAGSYEVVCEVL